MTLMLASSFNEEFKLELLVVSYGTSTNGLRLGVELFHTNRPLRRFVMVSGKVNKNLLLSDVAGSTEG